MGLKAPGILVAVALISAVLASSGDRSSMFQSCVALCSTKRCYIQQPVVLPLALRLTRWSCADDCRYSCMHEITSRDAESGTPAQQYYGKWPFWRFAGMQEPASVAFSLLNLWSHVRGARNIQKRIPNDHPMKTYYLAWSFVSVNAWFWSSIFHTRGKSHMNLHLNSLGLTFTPRSSFHRKVGLLLRCIGHIIRIILHCDPPVSSISSQNAGPAHFAF